jgi:hypothetical protein
VASQHPPELGHPVLPLVADVPQQPELPTRCEHPGHLRDGADRVHPVPGLCDEGHVDRVVGEGDLLGGPAERVNLRYGPDQDVTHPARRLDGDDLEAAVAQFAAELAGTGAQVEDTPGAGWQQPVERLGWIARPAPLVGGRSATERAPLRPGAVRRHGADPATRRLGRHMRGPRQASEVL